MGKDPPCLALQWLDNKVVSMLNTIDSANVKKQVTRNIKTPGGGGLTAIFHNQGLLQIIINI